MGRSFRGHSWRKDEAVVLYDELSPGCSMERSVNLVADPQLWSRLERAEAHRCVATVRGRAVLGPGGMNSVLRLGNGYCVYADCGWPLNRAIALGTAAPVRSSLLDTAEKFFRQRGAPAVIDCSPAADRSLRNQLVTRGYAIAKVDHVWIRSLDLPVVSPPAPQLALERVSPWAAEMWARTIAQGYAGEDVPSARQLDLLASFPKTAGVQCWVAKIGGIPAGGGAMFIDDRVAILFAASVLAGYRGRGIQTALLARRLAGAAESGCEVAVSWTKPGSGSGRNLARLGFEICYERLAMRLGS